MANFKKILYNEEVYNYFKLINSFFIRFATENYWVWNVEIGDGYNCYI